MNKNVTSMFVVLQDEEWFLNNGFKRYDNCLENTDMEGILCSELNREIEVRKNKHINLKEYEYVTVSGEIFYKKEWVKEVIKEMVKKAEL